MKSFRLVVAACVVALACACSAQQSKPVSLAEIVKHSRKPDKKKDVVEFSDANLQRSAPTDDDQADGAAAVVDTASPAGIAQSDHAGTDRKDAKEGKKPAESGKDQRIAELKKQLVAYQKEEQAWKDSIKNYQNLIANEPSDFRRQMYQDSLNNDQKNATLFQQKINEVQGELNKTQQQNSTTPSPNPDGETNQGGGAQP